MYSVLTGFWSVSDIWFLQGMYFDRDDVALPHFSRFFLERSMKERDQAEKLLEYQNTRGGRILLQTIAVSVEKLWVKDSPSDCVMRSNCWLQQTLRVVSNKL